MTTQEPLSIETYRKQRGTKGNFSFIAILSDGKNIDFSTEYIGIYKDPEDFVNNLLLRIITETAKQVKEDNQNIKDVSNYSYFYVTMEALGFKFQLLDKEQGVMAVIYRIYTRNVDEEIKFRTLIDALFQNLIFQKNNILIYF